MSQILLLTLSFPLAVGMQGGREEDMKVGREGDMVGREEDMGAGREGDMGADRERDMVDKGKGMLEPVDCLEDKRVDKVDSTRALLGMEGIWFEELGRLTHYC